MNSTKLDYDVASTDLSYLSYVAGGFGLFQHDDLLDVCDDIDLEFYQLIQDVTEHTPWFLRFFTDIVSQIASGITRNRMILRQGWTVIGQEDADEVANDSSPPEAVEVDEEVVDKMPGKLTETYSALLSHYGFSIAKALAYYPDPLATREGLQAIQALFLARYLIWDGIEAFYALSVEYCKLLRTSTQLHLHTEWDFAQLTTCELRLGELEAETGLSPTNCEWVRRRVFRVLHYANHIAERVFNSYARLLLKEACAIASIPSMIPEHFQNGATGLLRAIRSFDQSRGANLKSYASWWIRQSILCTLKTYETFIPIGNVAWSQHSKIQAARDRLRGKGLPHEDTDIARELGITVESISNAEQRVLLAQPRSLDAILSSDGFSLSMVTANELATPLEQLEDAEEEYSEATAMSALTRSERIALALHYGMVDYAWSYLDETVK